jgi:DNA gyrase inhibitor GyrI
MDLTIRKLEPMRVAALVSREQPLDFGAAWNKLRPTLKEQGLDSDGAKLAAVFKATSLMLMPPAIEWYAATMQLQEGQVVRPPLEDQRTDGGEYVVAVHKGSVDKLHESWAAFAQAFQEAGHRPDLRRACLEMYLSDQVTELLIPVRR